LVKGKILSLEVDGNNNKLESIQSISRHLATTLDKTLTGSNALELTEVDSWLDFAQYLVANRLTIADFAVLSSLKCTSLPF